jgi:hypothetical protein
MVIPFHFGLFSQLSPMKLATQIAGIQALAIAGSILPASPFIDIFPLGRTAFGSVQNY